MTTDAEKEWEPVDAGSHSASLRAWSLLRSRLLIGIAAGCLLALTLVITYDVVARYFFGAPTRWAYEVSKYLMAASVLLGAAHTMAVKAHIKVEILYEQFSERGRAVSDLLSGLSGFVFCAVLTWQSGAMALRSMQRGAQSLDLSVPLFFPQALVTIGALLVGIESILLVASSWRHIRSR